MNITNFYAKGSSNSENTAIRISRFPSLDISEGSDLSDSESDSEFSQTTIESEIEEEELILSEDESDTELDDNICYTYSYRGLLPYISRNLCCLLCSLFFLIYKTKSVENICE